MLLRTDHNGLSAYPGIIDIHKIHRVENIARASLADQACASEAAIVAEAEGVGAQDAAIIPSIDVNQLATEPDLCSYS